MASKTSLARPGRINITLDVLSYGSQRKKELPMKCLVVGNFSRGQHPQAPLERSRINVTRENLNAVLAQLKPRIRTRQGDELCIQSFQDFHPEGIVQQIPRLRRLVAMRQLLKDLQAYLLDDKELQKRLTAVLQSSQQRLALRQTLRPDLSQQVL